ncbi:MAG: hypothetical protein KAX27_00030 [Candidatus Aminicenantes bacterium]|nr:hypothetical protein [Candidatus Aminicenantes bacterium]
MLFLCLGCLFELLTFTGQNGKETWKRFKLTFVADKPPPAQVAYQEMLMTAKAGSEYFS